MTEPSLPDKVMAVHGRLGEAKVPHAFGGALALAYYAEPRATVDVDVNLFVVTARFPDVREALTPLGVESDVDEELLAREGQCRLRWGRTPLDLFFAYDKIHDAMKRDVRRVPFGEDRLPILSPEHLVVCKAAFDRAKDWIDIEQVLVGVDELDVAEIRQWLARLVGEDDPRTRRFAELAARFSEPQGV